MIRITIERFCTHCMASGKEVPAVVSYVNDRSTQFLVCGKHEDIAIAMGHERIPIRSREVVHEE